MNHAKFFSYSSHIIGNYRKRDIHFKVILNPFNPFNMREDRAGWLTKRLAGRGRPVRTARKTVMLLCALLPVPVLLAASTPHVWLAVALIGLATAGHAGWMANLFSLVSDSFPKSAVASVTGIGTMAGALGGILVARLAGWILDATGSYWPLFALSSSTYVAAWVIVHLLLPKKGLET